MELYVEFDWFIGLGVGWNSYEYWNVLSIQLPIISLHITIPHREIEEESEIVEDDERPDID